MASTAHVLMWLGAFVTYTLLMCPKLTQYETHKHYIAGSLEPWSPWASWVKGVSMGGPIALWTKVYNEFCDVSCSPLQRLAWLKAVSHNHISWASLNPWPDHLCWNMLSYSGLPTRLQWSHSRLPGESHMSEHPLFSPVVFQWLCNQMQSAWGVAAVKLSTF